MQEAHPGIAVDPGKEALITLGACEALSASMLALLNPGDEARPLCPLPSGTRDDDAYNF